MLPTSGLSVLRAKAIASLAWAAWPAADGGLLYARSGRCVCVRTDIDPGAEGLVEVW